MTSPKADFGAYSAGWGIEPYPADSRHAASHTEAVPTFSRTFSEGADTGTASSSSALWKATGNPPCLAQSEDGRFVLLHGAGGDAGDVFRDQAELGKIPFRDEAQLLRLDAAAAAHAEDEGTAGDIKVQHPLRQRVFAIPEDGMAACDILRVLEEGNLPGGGEMALEDSTGSAEGYGASVEQGGVEGRGRLPG